jgi:hypothetical protein
MQNIEYIDIGKKMVNSKEEINKIRKSTKSNLLE